MSTTDQHLHHLLRLYPTPSGTTNIDSLLSQTLTLLLELNNPLNITLLTSHFLTAPAIWDAPTSSQQPETCSRTLSLFSTAARQILRSSTNVTDARALSAEARIEAIISGADDRSQRWQHVLLLTGLMMGVSGPAETPGLGGLRRSLATAVVSAANLALQTCSTDGRGADTAIILALSYACPLLPEDALDGLDYDLLLPVAMRVLLGADGFEDGTFLQGVNRDLQQAGDRTLWPDHSPSHMQVRMIGSKVLVQALGLVAKLAALAIMRARDQVMIRNAQDALLQFTTNIMEGWQQIQLSKIEKADEDRCLVGNYTFLWDLMTNILFASVAVAQANVTRTLVGSRVRSSVDDTTALGSRTLLTLRNLEFISSRGEPLQIHTFTYNTSVDFLRTDPKVAASFLAMLRPRQAELIPHDALDRSLHLFYLNLVEHFSQLLPMQLCETLALAPAVPYMSYGGPMSPQMLELTEAAHSVMLAVLSCPTNGRIAVTAAPLYAESLLSAFPGQISARQFRFAFKKLIRILSPPFEVAATHPELAETVMEMVRLRVRHAAIVLLAATRTAPAADDLPQSEQSTLVLALIDALPMLSLDIYEEWLQLAAATISEVQDSVLREIAQRRFYTILSGGELDVNKAAASVAWWGSRGGRELVVGASHNSIQLAPH